MPDNFHDLKQTFDHLFGLEIPIFERIEPSIITILKAYGETNLSNLLGYLFKGEDHPLLKEIFLRALLDCLDLEPEIPQDDNIEDYLEEIKVHLEYVTQFGRIDILIRRDNKQPSKRWAIVLENKIHHTLNNDLDDYFYTVGRQFKILPKKIAVIVIALRDTFAGLQEHIPSQIILHSTMKANVHQLYLDHFDEINDVDSKLILTEYLRHIDDMYLFSTKHVNDAALSFFAKHRKLVNHVCKEHSGWSLDSLTASDRQFLIDNQHQTAKIIELQKGILKYMDRKFDHYLELSGRNVSGNSQVRYFRGSGSSYDLIRYQLDYKAFFSGEKEQLEFRSWLHSSVIKEMQIDMQDSDISQALAKVNANYTGTNADWVEVHSSKYIPSHANINNVLKESLTDDWLELEDSLSKVFEQRQIFDRYAKLRPIISDAEYNCEDHGAGIVFKDDIFDFFLRYKVNFVPPDYTEITLYINIHQWKLCSQALKYGDNIRLFTHLDDHQSWHIPELRDEISHDSVMNFDALAKRSYREPDADKAILRFEEELKIFKLLEKDLDQFYNS